MDLPCWRGSECPSRQAYIRLDAVNSRRCAARLATLAHNISLAAAVESARQFDDTLGQLMVSKGVALADLRGRLEGTLKAILVGEPEIAAEAKALGNVTGDFRGALDAMRVLGGGL